MRVLRPQQKKTEEPVNVYGISYNSFHKLPFKRAFWSVTELNISYFHPYISLSITIESPCINTPIWIRIQLPSGYQKQRDDDATVNFCLAYLNAEWVDVMRFKLNFVIGYYVWTSVSLQKTITDDVEGSGEKSGDGAFFLSETYYILYRFEITTTGFYK